MIDLFLKAVDQAALYAALESAGLMLTGEYAGLPRTASHTHALDVIGDLVKTPAVCKSVGGVWDEVAQDWIGGEIVVVTPAVMVGAWHANLRLLQPNAKIQAALASVTISEPARSQRVWA